MRIWLPLGALLLSAQAAPALADRDPYSGAPLPPHKHEPASPITDHFYIRAAFFTPRVRTNFRLDPAFVAGGVTGTPVSAEDDLGLPSRLYQGRVDFMFRLRERNKVRVDYYESNRSGSKVLTNTIIFGDETFAAGQLAQTTLYWQQFDITYTYSFIRNSRFEVGTGLAIYFLQIDATGQVPAQNQREERTSATPVPALPLDFTWCFAEHWSMTARAAYLKANLNGFSGWYADGHADVQYRWNPNFALGAGFSSIRTRLDRSGGTSPGTFQMNTTGPELFVRFSF
jgi:hypothetical protein